MIAIKTHIHVLSTFLLVGEDVKSAAMEEFKKMGLSILKGERNV